MSLNWLIPSQVGLTLNNAIKNQHGFPLTYPSEAVQVQNCTYTIYLPFRSEKIDKFKKQVKLKIVSDSEILNSVYYLRHR